MMNAWTDYPIMELGDAPRALAPIRQCRALYYDGNKYVRVEVGGVILEIKSGYVYRRPGRFGEVPHLRRIDLRRLAAPTPP